MMSLRERLRIDPSLLEEINQNLLDPDNPVINGLLQIVAKYGSPEEINGQAREARKLPNLLQRLREIGSPYLRDLEWLAAERDKGSFISISTFRRKVLGNMRRDGL